MEYKIDADNKILGRLASEVARFLRGKHHPSYHPARLSNTKVLVYHTDRIRVSGKKLQQKLYRHHSGFHGGLKEEALSRRLQRDSRIVVRQAVLGMLPKNRQRSKLIKNLTLLKGDEK